MPYTTYKQWHKTQVNSETMYCTYHTAIRHKHKTCIEGETLYCIYMNYTCYRDESIGHKKDMSSSGIKFNYPKCINARLSS